MYHSQTTHVMRPCFRKFSFHPQCDSWAIMPASPSYTSTSISLDVGVINCLYFGSYMSKLHLYSFIISPLFCTLLFQQRTTKGIT